VRRVCHPPQDDRRQKDGDCAAKLAKWSHPPVGSVNWGEYGNGVRRVSHPPSRAIFTQPAKGLADWARSVSRPPRRASSTALGGLDRYLMMTRYFTVFTGAASFSHGRAYSNSISPVPAASASKVHISLPPAPVLPEFSS
jgi:hypothetical protein